METLNRIRAAWKLSRGRCTSCDAILRDDATSRQCSDQCAQAEEMFARAW